MSILTVTTAHDVVDANDGRLSLREAATVVGRDPGADTIRFAEFLDGITLTLTSGELDLRGALTLDGDADADGARVTLSGGQADRVLSVVGRDASVRLERLDVAEGSVTDGNGGGILVGPGGALTLDGCTVRDSIAQGGQARQADGGGIFAGDGSQIAVLDSELSGNFAYGAGGAVATGADVRLSIADSMLRGNNAYSFGGAIAVAGGSRLVMERSDASGNRGGLS